MYLSCVEKKNNNTEKVKERAKVGEANKQTDNVIKDQTRNKRSGMGTELDLDIAI